MWTDGSWEPAMRARSRSSGTPRDSPTARIGSTRSPLTPSATTAATAATRSPSPTAAAPGGAHTPPPSVSILSPLNGTIVSGAVPVTASATDNVGVTSVQFAVDGTQVATSASAPYGFTWSASTASAGTHTITATAYDAAGNSKASSTSVSVAALADTTPPTVSIGSPGDGATLSGATAVQVNASDDVGVTQVALSVDGSVVSTLT